MHNLTANAPRTAITLAVILVSTALSLSAVAGDLLSLDMRLVAPAPGGSVPITVNIYDNDEVNPSDIVGTSTAFFNGGSLSGVSCDGVVCITGASLVDGNIVVTYEVDGWDNGQFKTWTTFEVVVGGSANVLALHTSCSQTLFVERPYPGLTGGIFYIEAGTGDCFVGAGECPPDGDLYWLSGEFRVPCTTPGPITFNVYKDDDQLRARATAIFTGGGLDNVVDAFAATLDGAYIEGNELVVQFTSYGYKDDGTYDSNSAFEIVTACGTYFLDQHTSCSREIYLNTALPASGGSTVTYTDGCGDCIETGLPPVDCPYDDKLYWVAGEFLVPCSNPANITFWTYEKDHFDEPEGTATAYFNGTSLTNVTNDLFAQLMKATVVNGQLLIEFEAFGWDNDKFKTETGFAVTVAGCGTFRIDKIHTSCSRPIPVDVPLGTTPSGTMTIRNYCGCEDSVVPTEIMNFGDVKSLWR